MQIGAGRRFGTDAKKPKQRMTRLTTMSIEVICFTRDELLPNPAKDSVAAVVWVVTDRCVGSDEWCVVCDV
jgi:hypothetical protein